MAVSSTKGNANVHEESAAAAKAFFAGKRRKKPYKFNANLVDARTATMMMTPTAATHV